MIDPVSSAQNQAPAPRNAAPAAPDAPGGRRFEEELAEAQNAQRPAAVRPSPPTPAPPVIPTPEPETDGAADSVEAQFEDLSPEMKRLVAEIVAEIFRRLGFRAPPDPAQTPPEPEPAAQTDKPARRRIQETQSERAARILKDQEKTMIENREATVRRLNNQIRDARSKTQTIVSRINRGL